jgi:hypothetical protein
MVFVLNRYRRFTSLNYTRSKCFVF